MEMSNPAAGRRARLLERLEHEGRYPRWVLVTALVGMFSTTFPITILTVSLGDIARDFNAGETTLAWVISGPLLASALALPVLGKLGDLYGHRRVFLIGFLASTVVAAVTAAAWNPGTLIGFRTLAQVIGSATQPTSMALIMTVYAPRDRVRALGYWSLVAAGAPAVGLIAGGPLVEALGWRLVFIAQAALSAAALAVAAVVLREAPRRAKVRFDVAGAVTLAVGTGGLMVVLSQGADWGWTNPGVLAAAVAAPVGVAAFVVAEQRAESPLLPLEFLRRRNFAAPMVANAFGGAAYMGGFILTPLLLRFVFGFSLSATALWMVVRPLTYSLTSPLGGYLSTRMGERGTAMLGSGALTVAMGGFAVGASVELTAVVIGALVMQGLGNGMARPPLTASMANAVDEGNLGISAAVGRMVYQIGASFGITSLTAVYGGLNEPTPFARAYVLGLALAAVSLAATTFVRSVDRTTPRETPVIELADPALGGPSLRP